MSYTRESGTLANRIYERLRKRSYRRAKTVQWDLSEGYPLYRDGHGGWEPWGRMYEHPAYLIGVRDTLDALAKEDTVVATLAWH